MNLNWFPRPTSFNRSSTSSCTLVPLKPQRKGNDIVIVSFGECCERGLAYPKSVFQNLPGVERVIVGYTGGQHCSPTSEDLQDHVEAILIEFHERTVSLDDIMAAWNDLIANSTSFLSPSVSAARSLEVLHQPAIFATSQFQHGQIVRVLRFLGQYETLPSSPLHMGVHIYHAGQFHRAQDSPPTQQNRKERGWTVHTPSPPNVALSVVDAGHEKCDMSPLVRRQELHAPKSWCSSDTSATLLNPLTKSSLYRSYSDAKKPSPVPQGRKNLSRQEGYFRYVSRHPPQQQQQQQQQHQISFNVGMLGTWE
jgi:peptide methionine sulfoxide reductase MsrA